MSPRHQSSGATSDGTACGGFRVVGVEGSGGGVLVREAPSDKLRRWSCSIPIVPDAWVVLGRFRAGATDPRPMKATEWVVPTDLDIPLLESLVAQGPTAVFATVSGAHLYGFASPDSDVDLRGAFVQTLGERLRLRPSDETITIMRDQDGLELDWVAHDVRKFAKLMTQRNGYVLEQLFSPLVVVGGEWHEELKSIGRGCIVRHLYHHYRGFAQTQRKALASSSATVKDLLYAYRVYLTGVHVLRTGEVEANLASLAEERGDADIQALIGRKVTGREKEALDPEETRLHLGSLDRLEEELMEAFETSTLPDEPTTFDLLSDFVVRAATELGGE